MGVIVMCKRGGGGGGGEVSEPVTRLVACRSSKEHRHMNGVGECEGSKYVCTCFRVENPMFL